jgi:hypothetical protein
LQHLKNVKNWPRPLFRPRTDHACHKKLNPSLETVPFTETYFVRLFEISKYIIKRTYEDEAEESGHGKAV